MDTVKQALMGIIGSMALGGCLTDPNIIRVPDTQQEETAEDGDTGGTAAAWPATRPQGDLFGIPASARSPAFCAAFPDVAGGHTPAVVALREGALV